MREFLSFLNSKSIKRELLWYGLAGLVVYIIFSILYPTAFIFADSGSYVLSAVEPSNFNIYRPMGYSAYLSFLHGISPSLGFAMGVSYWLHIFSSLFLLFSFRYLLKLRGGLAFTIVAICVMFAPSMLFATNFIMSDSLFTSLTMLFLATALWIVFSRNWWIVALHLLLFWALYSVRYSGMFYVPISVLAMLFSPLGRKFYIRAALALAPMLLFVALFANAKSNYKENTGFDTFSGFNGWQLLNNASVLIPSAKSTTANQLSSKAEVQFAHQFFSTFSDSLYSESNMLYTSQMWTRTLPLRQFTSYMMQQNDGANYGQAWIYCGTVFQDYALALIKNDPCGYFKKYILASAGSIFKAQPIVEHRNVFNNEPMYRDYYGLTFDRYTPTNQGLWDFFNIINKWLNPLFWVLVFGGVAMFCWRDCRTCLQSDRSSALLLLVGFVVIYIVSSIIAAPSTSWRYMLPIFSPVLLISLYYLEKFK